MIKVLPIVLGRFAKVDVRHFRIRRIYEGSFSQKGLNPDSIG